MVYTADRSKAVVLMSYFVCVCEALCSLLPGVSCCLRLAHYSHYVFFCPGWHCANLAWGNKVGTKVTSNKHTNHRLII